MKVVLILPTYNERDNIIRLLDALRQTNARSRHDIRYLVVDDTSPDGTADVVRTYQKNHHDVVLIEGRKEGLGKALLRGIRHAAGSLRADYIVQMDADLSHDPEKVPEFIRKLDQGADFVVGSRYIPGGSIPSNWGIHRKIFSVAGNAIVRYGLGYASVHDWTGGFRAYRRKFSEILEKELDQYRGYVFQIAFLHKAMQKGASVVEVPIHFHDRRFGSSKIAPSEYIRNVLEYVIRNRIERIRTGNFGKFLVVGTIGFIINTVILEMLVRYAIHPGLSSAVGAEFAIVSNFILNNNWTFRERSIGGLRQVYKFLQFNMTSLGALLIQSATVTAGTWLTGLQYYRYYYLLGVGIGLVWNYTMYSRVIWKKVS